jgi:hypothetical protein
MSGKCQSLNVNMALVGPLQVIIILTLVKHFHLTDPSLVLYSHIQGKPMTKCLSFRIQCCFVKAIYNYGICSVAGINFNKMFCIVVIPLVFREVFYSAHTCWS